MTLHYVMDLEAFTNDPSLTGAAWGTKLGGGVVCQHTVQHIQRNTNANLGTLNLGFEPSTPEL